MANDDAAWEELGVVGNDTLGGGGSMAMGGCVVRKRDFNTSCTHQHVGAGRITNYKTLSTTQTHHTYVAPIQI